MFAYKPEEEKEVVTANGKRGAKIRDIKGTQKESNPVYSARKTKPGQKQDNTGKRAFLI